VCFLSGRGQGHVSNFYIVDLENFATASRRYTGDIHNTPMVGLFMTPIVQWKRLDRVAVACTCLLHTCTVSWRLLSFCYLQLWPVWPWVLQEGECGWDISVADYLLQWLPLGRQQPILQTQVSIIVCLHQNVCVCVRACMRAHFDSC